MKISDVNMERKLTGGEKRSKEANFKKLKKHKKDFKKRYGDDAESVMHAVATKRAKNEEKDEQPAKVKGYDTKTITALADLKLRYPHAPDTLSAMLRAMEDIKAASKGADRDVEREIDDLEARIKSVETKMKKHKTHEGRKKNKNPMGPQEIAVGDRVEFEGEKFEVIDVELDTIVADNLVTGLRNRLHTDKVTKLFGMDAMTDQDKADAEAMFKRLKKVGSGSLKHVATEMNEAQNSRFPTTTMTADFVNWLKSKEITMVQLDDPVKRWNMMQQYKKETGKNVIPLGNEMKEMTEWLKVNEGYYSLPPIDRKRYDEMPGMDGPIMTRSGKVVYYDPKSGQYYDRDSDMFLSYDEFKDLDNYTNDAERKSEYGINDSRVHDNEMDQAARLRRRIARAKRAGDIDAQKKAEEELKAIFAKGLHIDRAQEDINEADDPLAILRRIVDNKQAEKIHGVMVDMFTASALVQVYDKVNDENQIKMKKFLQSAQGLERMAEFALSKLS